MSRPRAHGLRQVITDEGQKILDEAARRAALTVWGEQEHPRVLSYTVQQGEYWLVRNDEFLTRHQGSYRQMITTPYAGAQSLRGYRGMLVVIITDRAPVPKHWDEVMGWLGSTPGISTWTEVLP